MHTYADTDVLELEKTICSQLQGKLLLKPL